MKILVTGGAGFIGSAFVLECLKQGHQVVVLDALTYAGHPKNLQNVENHPGYRFIKGDILDSRLVSLLLREEQIESIVHLAAESHVDNSIVGPEVFIQTNVVGTFRLLQCAQEYYQRLIGVSRDRFRFVAVSTDEVFGSLPSDGFFTEESPYLPNSPYSASKAGSDHLARAWFHTYGLPTITTNCSNNYGPRQFPEKFIPVIIQKCISRQPIPIYGKGLNIRDWIHVEDHSRGLLLALTQGRPGETYCFGGRSEKRNIELAETVCTIFDRKNPEGKPHKELISFVADRPGHDWRYAIDDTKAQDELGFVREFRDFEMGLEATVEWYLTNQDWVRAVVAKRGLS